MTTALLSLTFLLATQPATAAPTAPSAEDSGRQCIVPAGVTSLTVEIAVTPGQRVVEVEGGRITRVEFGPTEMPKRNDPRSGRTMPPASPGPGPSADTAVPEPDSHELRVARWANAQRRVRELERRLTTHADADPRDPRLVQLRGELSRLAAERDHWETSLRAEGWTPPVEPIHTTRLVVGPQRITIDDLETTWKEVPRLMRYWPDRRESTLLILPGPEVATRSEAIELGRRIQELADETYFKNTLLDLGLSQFAVRATAPPQSSPVPQADADPSLTVPLATPTPRRNEPPPTPRMEPPRSITAGSQPATATPSDDPSSRPYDSLLGMHIERLTRYMALLEEVASRVATEVNREDATAAARREALRLHQQEFAALLAAAEEEYIRSVESQSATIFPTDRKLSWPDLEEILNPARDQLLELGNRFDALAAVMAPDSANPRSNTVPPRLRVQRFARLVDDSSEQTLDGVPTDPKQLSRALGVPTRREQTVLEVAVTPERAEALDAAGRARLVDSISNLAGVLGYEGVDDVGVQPLGSLGHLPRLLIATPVCPEHGPVSTAGDCPYCGKPTKTEWREFAADRNKP